tara:strand:- start:256 stop:549 length:294 start_codon:yes stop_codon:yes gene_type:complete
LAPPAEHDDTHTSQQRQAQIEFGNLKYKESAMNQNQWEGKWDQMKGQLRQAYGDLTDQELESTKGDREELVGRIKEKYGDTKETINQKIDEIASKLN